MHPFQWECGFCQRKQMAIDKNTGHYFQNLYVGETKYGSVGITFFAIRCLNPECNELTLSATLSLSKYNSIQGKHYPINEVFPTWHLRPDSFALPQPEYIPSVLREDYYEACKIRDLSPKASATLSRRCLQGMIRDFCGISDKQLIKEINELKKHVDAGNAPAGVTHETMDAIDAVREIGNIGAHMEKDIDLIIEVDAGEAQALIDLIEMLFDEWYVARNRRQERLVRIVEINAAKKAEKAAHNALAAPLEVLQISATPDAGDA